MMIIRSCFIMNLKNKSTYTLLGALIVILLSYSMWKKGEADVYRKRIYALQGQLIESEHHRISSFMLYVPVYNNYLNHKSSIQEKTGSKTSVLI